LSKQYRNQASFIVVGIIMIFVGISLNYTPVEPIIDLFVTTSGLALLISGLRYQDRKNTQALSGEERKNILNLLTL
jgi:hypothetical protein